MEKNFLIRKQYITPTTHSITVEVYHPLAFSTHNEHSTEPALARAGNIEDNEISFIGYEAWADL